MKTVLLFITVIAWMWAIVMLLAHLQKGFSYAHSVFKKHDQVGIAYLSWAICVAWLIAYYLS